MTTLAVLSFAGAYFSLIIAAAVLLRDRESFVHRVVAAGMLLFAAEEIFRGISSGAVLPEDVIYWQKRVIAASALLLGVLLAFSLSYARAGVRSFLSKWKWLLLLTFASIPFVVIFRKCLFVGSIVLRDAG